MRCGRSERRACPGVPAGGSQGPPMPTATVILPAAGRGARFAMPGGGGRASPVGAPETKVFISLAGRPVLAHTLDRFAALEAVVEVIVPVPPEAVAWARETFGERTASGRPLIFVGGGEDRVESVAEALAASDGKSDLVVIHDAVRPLVRRAVVEEAMRVAMEMGAAVVGRPVDHTVKRVSDGRLVAETVPRENLWLAQTPQVFRRDVIAQAYARRRHVVGRVTDDAQLVEAMGGCVAMVRGDAANVKITTVEDLRLCEALLEAGWPSEK